MAVWVKWAELGCEKNALSVPKCFQQGQIDENRHSFQAEA